MVEPYQAVGLIQTMRGIRRREEIVWNLEHISHMVKAASWLSSMDLPVRLICIPEGGVRALPTRCSTSITRSTRETARSTSPARKPTTSAGWRDSGECIRDRPGQGQASGVPGPFLQRRFRDRAPGRDRDPEAPQARAAAAGRAFGYPAQRVGSLDRAYGRKLDAFYPVADTDIGRIGIMMANEASYPENARGLAMNGCEIAYRGPYPAPGVMSGMFSVQNRARALDNNMYVIGMNLGTYYLDRDSETPIDTFSGGSQIVDYRGQIVTEVPYGAGSTWIAGIVDIEALRHFRQTAQWDNWMKDLTTEQYQLIYEQSIYPKNLYLDRRPYTHAEYREQVTQKQVELLQKRGIWSRR